MVPLKIFMAGFIAFAALLQESWRLNREFLKKAPPHSVKVFLKIWFYSIPKTQFVGTGTNPGAETIPQNQSDQYI